MICEVVVTDVRTGSGLPENLSSVGVTVETNFSHDFNLCKSTSLNTGCWCWRCRGWCWLRWTWSGTRWSWWCRLRLIGGIGRW